MYVIEIICNYRYILPYEFFFLMLLLPAGNMAEYLVVIETTKFQTEMSTFFANESWEQTE